ncbi:MAG TPA: XisI protein [Blastocatellia bacterium]
MDTLDHYRNVVEKLLTEYAMIPYAYGEVKTEPVFDRNGDHYLLVNVGWDQGLRVHGCLVHIDLIDGKLWIQRDGTEQGMACELEEAGIPKDHIVLGFRAPELRKYTDYAVA